MSVLVTGGAGYIGGHMVLELLDQGERPVILDNLSTGVRWSVPEGVPLVVGDFGDAELVARVLKEHKVEAIAHFAAKLVVPESLVDPLGYYLNNVAKARTLLECAVQAGAPHFIFSSTAAVYGEVGIAPVAEDEPKSPVSPYGRSKLMVEWMLEDVARAHGLHYVALRYFNVAGADPRGRNGQSSPLATHLIKVAAQTALGRRGHLDVYGTDYPTPDGSCLRDYIQVTDLVRAHVAALAHLRRGGENMVLNCGYGQGFSVLDIVDVVKRVSGVNFRVDLQPRRPGDPPSIVADAGKIRAALGWEPRHANIEEIVGQALSWERRLHNRGQGFR